MKALNYVWFAVVASSLFVPVVVNAETPGTRRVAVLVGANEAAPGRKTLRYSHDDVRSVSSVLKHLGGFASDDVAAMYDPEPSEVLRVLDDRLEDLSASGGESMLFFYYSGHADAHHLFPNGQPLPLREIRTRLEHVGPSIRLGLVDACRGGGWTAVKGLVATDAFEIDLPMELASEGSAFIASSSGLEDAHESEALGGSFFTHHWVAALRGAADRNEDGRVTLAESFDYAKEMTIRDTALVADAPQHPSFQYNLCGRRDLPLARLHQEHTLIALKQSQGPLQLIDLRSGLIVLEIPSGKKALKLAVPPGKYLVRRREGERTLAREVSVVSGKVTPVNEANLKVMAMPETVSKGGLGRSTMNTTLPASFEEISFGMGVIHDDVLYHGVGFQRERGFGSHFQAHHAFSDRLQWLVPTLGFSYRFGEPGETEWIPWGGVIGWGAGFSSVEDFIFQAQLGAGTDVRWWLGSHSSLNVGIGLTSHFQGSTGKDGRSIEPDTWRFSTAVGYSHILGDHVSFHSAIRLSQNLTRGDRSIRQEWSERPIGWTHGPFDSKARSAALTIGSTQSFGLRSLPIVQIHLGDVWSADLHASLTYSFPTKKVSETYMVGSTWTF